MFIFPVWLFNPTKITARVVESVISGGTSLAGEEDVIATDGGGRWEVAYEGITLRTPHQIKAWEGWQGYLGNGATDCLALLLSVGHANRPSMGRGLMPVSKMVTDADVWPTRVSYAAPHIVASVSASAALRATTLAIEVTKGAPLIGGEKFSLGQRVYRVVRPLGGGQFHILPPLREAVTAGTPCNFDMPRVKVRSAPGESFSPTLDFGRRGEVSIRFLENAA